MGYLLNDKIMFQMNFRSDVVSGFNIMLSYTLSVALHKGYP